MKVSLISSSFYPAIFYGGPISATWGLSKKLGEKEVEVYVSTTNANGIERLKNVNTKSYEKVTKNVFVRYYHEQIINMFSLSFIFGIFSDIRRSDVVYIQYLFHYTVLISLLYSFLLKKKIILCPRGSFSSFTLSNKRSWLKKIWLNIFISPFKNKIIWQASSYLEKQDILSRFENARVVIIADGIDFESFQQSDNIHSRDLVKKYTNMEFQEVSEVVFSMGRLHKIKGFDVLIDAFCIYVKDNPNSKLLIAGEDDGAKDELEIQIQKLNLEESVFLIGLVNFNQKKELLTNSSIFILASEFESFGIVIPESLACGTPVIVSDKTAWKDIEKNNCGIFVKKQKEHLSNAFQQIKINNFTENNCKKYVEENFDWEVILEKFLQLITKS
jgi:glycosyltransferase involved in cell wall biosynthesis|tara:strand:+ start:14 stop:1174 length:1161 start_codon:yes stop_codon:yes gene_type:complete